MRKSNKRPAGTRQPPDTIPFFEAVREAKEIAARIKDAERGLDRDHWRLGELAYKVETKYDDRTLSEMAKASGIATSTLYHDRSVYKNWKDIKNRKDILPPGAKFPSLAVLKELEKVDERAELIKAEPDMSKRRAAVHRVLKDHPKREEIRRKYPDLTCTRQARDIMDSYDAKGAGNGKGGNAKNSSAFKRWFNAAIKRCIEDMDET